MSRFRICAAIAALCTLLAPAVAPAQVPHHLNHQGILTTNDGVIVPDGEYVLEFQIHDTPSASGTPLFSQQLTVNVVKGLYNVLLSDNGGSSLDDAFDGATRYLQIRIVSGSGYNNLTLAPRQQIASVPYALVAGRVVDAESPPSTDSLNCHDVDTLPSVVDRYKDNGWTDAQVACTVTVPAAGYAILVHGALFADNEDAANNSLLGRIRENCGGSTTTVASGIDYVTANTHGRETDLAYIELSFIRTNSAPGLSCTYTIEGRAEQGGLNDTFDTNAGADPDDVDDLPNPEDFKTWIGAVALPLH